MVEYTLYPRQNLLLINGNICFEKSFIVFLDYLHEYSLYKEINNNIVIDFNEEIINVLENIFINNIQDVIKKYNKTYNRAVIILNIQNLLQNRDIFNYINISKIKIIIKHIISNLTTYKINYYNTTCNNLLIFNSSCINNSPQGRVLDLLNTINFKLAHK